MVRRRRLRQSWRLLLNTRVGLYVVEMKDSEKNTQAAQTASPLNSVNAPHTYIYTNTIGTTVPFNEIYVDSHHMNEYKH